MKKLYLTTVITVPSEEGQKRIDEALEKESTGIQNVFRDDYGRSRGDYEEMNMRIPSYFDEEEAEFYKNSPKSEISEDGFMQLDPDEIDYTFLDFILPLREFVSVTDTLEFGSLVKEQDGTLTHVQETAEEINFYIDYLNRSKWQALKDTFTSFFRRIKYRFQNKKKVNFLEQE